MPDPFYLYCTYYHYHYSNLQGGNYADRFYECQRMPKSMCHENKKYRMGFIPLLALPLEWVKHLLSKGR